MPWSYSRGRRKARVRPPRVLDLDDEFLVPDPNPLSQPRICEPGPGTLFWQDLDNRLSVTFGALQFAGASAAWDRTYLYSQTSFQRKSGRFLEFEWTPQNVDSLRVGWQKGKSGLIQENVALIYFGSGATINVVDDLDVVSPLYPYVTFSTSDRGRVYDTGDGFLYYINEQPSASWTLLWRKELSPSRLESLWPAVQNIAQQGTRSTPTSSGSSSKRRSPRLDRLGSIGPRACPRPRSSSWVAPTPSAGASTKPSSRRRCNA